MKRKEMIAVVLTVLFISSCVTPRLWEVTDPNEYVEITGSSLSTQDLEDKGVQYRSDEGSGRVFAEKSALRKFSDYTVRTFATPLAVIIDVAGVTAGILVVGTIAVAKEQWDEELEKHPENPQSIEIYPGRDDYQR